MLATLIPMTLWQSGAAKAAGAVFDGRRPSIRQAFLGNTRTIGTAALYALLVVVGTVLFVLPGLVLAVLFFYAVPAAVHGAKPRDALKQSLTLAKTHLGTTIVSCLILAAVAVVLGGIQIAMTLSIAFGIFLVTLIAIIPLATLLQFALHLRVSGYEMPEPVRA